MTRKGNIKPTDEEFAASGLHFPDVEYVELHGWIIRWDHLDDGWALSVVIEGRHVGEWSAWREDYGKVRDYEYGLVWSAAEVLALVKRFSVVEGEG